MLFQESNTTGLYEAEDMETREASSQAVGGDNDYCPVPLVAHISY
jgi:hypothetical protein